ncbi:subtilase family protein [Pseudoduganella lurida]|uniref:Subtilase family protein n=1 Tax=Pseudoduganella lurida TaxID=1036180 RepID=A0A562RJL7_9BURK|nr:S8 family peptidase [Pseudoduganella lurida]TWI69123.1 subtilase family protein [Pseudoduganella lurida]
MAATNIILGYGETLTHPYELKRGSGDKKYPYFISEQRQWLGSQLYGIIRAQAEQPAVLKPRGESVAKFTLHPAFLAKSHHPNDLLNATGLRCVGSRSATVVPRKVTSVRQKAGEELFTATLYVAGTDRSFERLSEMLQSSRTAQTHQKAFCRFELMQRFTAHDKNLTGAVAANLPLLEVVLHASAEDSDIVKAFEVYAESLGGVVETSRALVVSGLTFIPVRVPAAAAVELAAFHFVRAVRVMPSLRIGGREMRGSSVMVPSLPTMPAIDPSLKVAVFDGGIGHSDLSPWVKETILPGAEVTSAAYLNHGNAVTSSVLFGPIDEAANEFARPYANVHHYRCISPALQAPSGVPDADLYDVLKHIDNVLKNEKPDFLNLSIGPYMPMDDDEVHPWTALIDSHLASGETLATVAVGNDGDKVWPDSRVQPPSDMVNALAVGACDITDAAWSRATYSSHGPGRSPGMVKPDGVGFGGSDAEPFVFYNALAGQYAYTTGTSFSSPATLRTAIGVKVSLNSPLSLLAVRALMSHHASRPKHMLMSHVGHGRFPQSVEEVLTCDDNEVRVIYQGTLQAGQNLRALIPFPTLPLKGKVTLRATLCFASHTDPEHAVNYTRAGLTVVLRPKKTKKDTMTFFSSSKMYTSELEARTDDQKWETTLKHEHRFNVDTLDDPIFDITYGAREDGQSVDNKSLPPLPYAMIVTVSAEDTPGVYNNIRQRYQTLQPVEIRQEVRIKTATGRP